MYHEEITENIKYDFGEREYRVIREGKEIKLSWDVVGEIGKFKYLG